MSRCAKTASSEQSFAIQQEEELFLLSGGAAGEDLVTWEKWIFQLWDYTLTLLLCSFYTCSNSNMPVERFVANNAENMNG